MDPGPQSGGSAQADGGCGRVGVIGESRGADGPEPSVFPPDRPRRRTSVWGGLQAKLAGPDAPEEAPGARAVRRSGGAFRFPENSTPPERAVRRF